MLKLFLNKLSEFSENYILR